MWSFGESKPDLSTIVAVIARSRICVTARHEAQFDLPAGFDDVDLAILDWILAENSPVKRRYPLC